MLNFLEGVDGQHGSAFVGRPNDRIDTAEPPEPECLKYSPARVGDFFQGVQPLGSKHPLLCCRGARPSARQEGHSNWKSRVNCIEVCMGAGTFTMLTGAIGGAGALTKTDAGTLVLTANNIHSAS
jgi:hypothetical protein